MRNRMQNMLFLGEEIEETYNPFRRIIGGQVMTRILLNHLDSLIGIIRILLKADELL
jgi:hypothetical protein